MLDLREHFKIKLEDYEKCLKALTEKDILTADDKRQILMTERLIICHKKRIEEVNNLNHFMDKYKSFVVEK